MVSTETICLFYCSTSSFVLLWIKSISKALEFVEPFAIISASKYYLTLTYKLHRLFTLPPCVVLLCRVVKKNTGDKHGTLSQQSKVEKLLSVQVYNGNLPTCDSIYIKDSGLVGILIIDVNCNEWFITKANQKLLSPGATWGILYIYNSRTCCHCLGLPTYSWVTMVQSFCFPLHCTLPSKTVAIGCSAENVLSFQVCFCRGAHIQTIMSKHPSSGCTEYTLFLNLYILQKKEKRKKDSIYIHSWPFSTEKSEKRSHIFLFT